MIERRRACWNKDCRVAPCARRAGWSRRSSADEERGRWEDEVGWGEAVPGGVLEGPIGLGLVAIVVDEDHEGDGEAAQDVERE